MPALKPPKARVDAGHMGRSDNVRSMHAISSRRAANAVLAAGARLAELKDVANVTGEQVARRP